MSMTIHVLPPELVEYILKFLPSLIDKDTLINSLFPNYNSLIKKEKENFISKEYHPLIISMMGGLNKMLSYPMLKYKQEFCDLDYIDKIKVTDISAPIMLGKDNYNRAFITIYEKNNDLDTVFTIFKRFSNDMYSWTSGTFYCSSKLISISKYLIDYGVINDPISYDRLKNYIKSFDKKFIKYYTIPLNLN